MSISWDRNITADTIYLPAENKYNEDGNNGVPIDEEIQNYINREFPLPSDENSGTVSYSIPAKFVFHGEHQASQAEFNTFNRFCGVQLPEFITKGDSSDLKCLWQACFQGVSYAGRSYRSGRDGKLVTREHDLVVFNRYQEKYFISLIEVKSTCDDPNIGYKVSDASTIKNNKRCGQHQIRDHLEILEKLCNVSVDCVHSYLFWPFLTGWTNNSAGKRIKRWDKESEQHVFTDTISDQEKFNNWFHNSVLSGKSIEKTCFDKIFKRFIVLSCGIIVNEIRDDALALLTQEQLELLYCKPSKSGSPTIVHGAAGTGKTLLILHRLRFLYDCGLLNEKNKALYICYWPGIRTDFLIRLEKLNISKYVDTVRFGITNDEFLHNNRCKYRHIFMDECEAICLSFHEYIVTNTFNDIENHRLIESNENYNVMEESYDKNYKQNSMLGYMLENNEIVKIQPKKKQTPVYGDLWFLVDINQATMFTPKYSPNILKKPTVRLTRVVRNTETIYKTFSSFYKNPLPTISAAAKLSDFYLKDIEIGHKIRGPPIFWVNVDNMPNDAPTPDVFSTKTFNGLISVIVDLYSAKGIKPNDLCVLPFVVSKAYLADNINKAISHHFATINAYHPVAFTYIEEFLTKGNPMEFLVLWVLRVKGLEFKVVVMAIEEEDFDHLNPEDRRKIYIMASRCTCLLILVCSEQVKNTIDVHRNIKPYQFDIKF